MSIPTEPTSVCHHKLNATPDAQEKKPTYVLHHKLNTPRCTKGEHLLTVQGIFACCPRNLAGTQPSLGPTELGHHLCYDRAHLGVRLVLGEVGRIVHHCNQGLKTLSLHADSITKENRGPSQLHVSYIYLRLNGNHYANF
jgi:hypothetical protein